MNAMDAITDMTHSQLAAHIKDCEFCGYVNGIKDDILLDNLDVLSAAQLRDHVAIWH